MSTTWRKDGALVLEAQQSFEEGAVFSRHNDGVLVVVSQEQAVDSYNASFSCELTMTREQAVELHRWLSEVLA